MREMLTMAAGERAANYDGLQVRTTGRHSISSFCASTHVPWALSRFPVACHSPFRSGGRAVYTLPFRSGQESCIG